MKVRILARVWPLSPASRRRQIDVMELLDQPVVMLGQADDLDLAARRPEGAHQPFEHPATEGVEALDPAHVDAHRAHRQGLALRLLDERLELVGVFRRPGAGRGKFHPIAVRGALEQGLPELQHSGFPVAAPALA
jgi:hypothetical protein